MTRFVVDTSAIIAILKAETDARKFAEALHQSNSTLISSATLHEAACVVIRKKVPSGIERLLQLVEGTEMEEVPFDQEQSILARIAYSRFGIGTSHPAHLNLGDCFSYALAKSRNLPLLFKGDDFVHTDVEPAIAAG